MKGMNIGLQVVRGIIVVLGAVLCIGLASNWTDEMETAAKLQGTQNFLQSAEDCDPDTISVESLKQECENKKSYVNQLSGGFNLTFIALIICIAGAIGFGIWSVINNPKRNLRAVLGIVLVVIIGAIGYSMASGEVSETWNSGVVNELGMTEALEKGEEHDTSKYSGAGLKTFYILLGLTLASVVYLEVSKIFK